jgi:hypothetical protein
MNRELLCLGYATRHDIGDLYAMAYTDANVVSRSYCVTGSQSPLTLAYEYFGLQFTGTIKPLTQIRSRDVKLKGPRGDPER